MVIMQTAKKKKQKRSSIVGRKSPSVSVHKHTHTQRNNQRNRTVAVYVKRPVLNVNENILSTHQS